MKKKIINLTKKFCMCFLMIMPIIITSSCNKDNYQTLDDAIAIVYEKNVPYLINPKLEKVSLARYDWIEDNFDDYIIVKKDGLFGYIDHTGKEIISPKYVTCYPFKENKAVVSTATNQLIIDENDNVLYTFPSDITSNSYFSQNKLLIEKDGLFGFITYQNNNFIVGQTLYPYLSAYKNDYAIVGKYETEIIYKTIEVIDGDNNVHTEPTDEIDYIITKENLKYNYLTLDEELLFDEFSYDFADWFYDGWARVANYGNIYAEPAGKRDGSKEAYGLIYNYINKDQEEFHLDYEYVYSHLVYSYDQWGRITDSTLVNEDIHDTSLVSYPYATNFYDGYCTVAKYVYSGATNMFMKEYMIIDKDGHMDYVEAIYFAPTSFRYGYDSSYDYRTQTGGKFSVTRFVNIGDVHCFRVGNTLSNPYYTIKYTTYDYIRNFNVFEDVIWDTFKTTYDESGNAVITSAPWMENYIKTYLPTAKTNVLAKAAAESPYEMEDLTFSKFYSSTSPITGARIIRSNTYGIIALTPVVEYNSEHETNITKVHADYIIPPIYDKVIY